MTPALSFVIPLYNSAATIASLVHDIEDLPIDGGHEINLEGTLTFLRKHLDRPED